MRTEIFEKLREALGTEEPVALATALEGPLAGNQLLIWASGETLGDLGGPRLNQRAALFAEKLFHGQSSARKSIEHNGTTVDVFFDFHAPPAKLVIVGAVHVAIHLIEFARALGMRTVVIDPRSAFATAERFAAADQLLHEWPDEAMGGLRLTQSTYVAVLSHDFKIDLPALEAALRSPARYIGALGSKKTHQKRIDALRESGFSDEEILRIHAPIGLDLGGRRAEEIALAIAAQMVAVRHGR